MTPEAVLARPPRVLSQTQREFYFENGYLLVPGIVPADWVKRLRAVTGEMVERSRELARSDNVFDLEVDHRPERPRLRRLSSPTAHHPLYWEFASKSLLPDIVVDLVGPDVKFHHSKLDFKWAEGGAEVKWHQDISWWPHTNYSPLTAGLYLYDCGRDQGPLMVVPGTHRGDLFNQYDDQGNWAGCLSERDAKVAAVETADVLTGPAGSLTIHNCRVIHGSCPNLSNAGRPLLLNVYSAADAFSYTANPLPSPHAGTLVRGRPARFADHDPRPCPIPPDWSGGYTSLFALQQGEPPAGERAVAAAHM
jgi:ectoine hydroxylase-related dioxygenase (phytanoyl-CoA dioxygenase family)